LKYLLLVALLLVGFALRLHGIDSQSLRGDEAFAVRYWAQDPAETLRALAWQEPHPFGTYLSFWAWRSLAGDSELAMRLLPALVNLLGVAAVWALARRLISKRQSVVGAQYSAPLHPTPNTQYPTPDTQYPIYAFPLLAAALFAFNPNLIWHSQDARNYAMWAGMSAVALWLLVRATQRNTRRDWALYAVVETMTLYLFFMEAVMLVVHALYVAYLAWRGLNHRGAKGTEGDGHQNSNSIQRLVLKPYHFVLCTLHFVLLIPWFYQVYRLAGSGYGGTAGGADLNLLVQRFIPELLFGEYLANTQLLPFGTLITALVLLLALVWLLRDRQAGVLLLLMLVVPAALLFIISTRMDVFRPRYIIAATPALCLLLAWGIAPFFDWMGGVIWRSADTPLRVEEADTPLRVEEADTPLRVEKADTPLRVPTRALSILGAVMVVGFASYTTVASLRDYYANVAPKSPDWRGLAAYLREVVTLQTLLIVQSPDGSGGIDPTFAYYYDGAFITLPRPDVQLSDEIGRVLAEYERVVVVDSGGTPLRLAFAEAAAVLSERDLSPFYVSVFGSR
jgi:hypothetical protein